MSQNRILYLARFEMGQAGQDLQHPEAVLQSAQQHGDVAGWMEFLSGFPYDCLELKALLGEISSIPDLQANLAQAQSGPQVMGDLVPPFPQTLFGGYEPPKIIRNYIDLDSDMASALGPDISDAPIPQNLHWWFLVNFVEFLDGDSVMFPYPGEYMALAVRLFMDRYWVSQESNPFLMSGNWFDTVFLTSGFIQEIKPPTDEMPWPQYVVQWRPNPEDPNSTGTYLLFPSDFQDYQVGDRVSIVKDVTANKPTQLWDDDDMMTMGGADTGEDQPVPNCSIAPLQFYGFDPEQQQQQGG